MKSLFKFICDSEIEFKPALNKKNTYDKKICTPVRHLFRLALYSGVAMDQGQSVGIFTR